MKKLLSLLLIALTSNPAFAALPGRIQNEDVKSLSDIQSSVLSTTGNLTNANACISSIASTTGLAVGQFAYDSTNPTYISSGTTIAGLPGTCSAGQVQLSSNATHAATGDTITFGGQASQLINDTKVYVTANSINQQLSAAITSGALGGGGGGGVQLLSNPGFEIGSSGNPPSSWTLTATTGSISTSTYYAGTQAELLTASSQQSKISQDVTPANGFYSGVNMEASCKVQTTLSNVQVCSRAAGADVNCTAVPSSGTWQYVPVNFVGPASGSVGVEVSMTSSSTGTIYVDDCYVGPARNVGTVAQAQYLGSLNITGCAGVWSGGNTTSYTNFTAQSGCTYTATGSLLAPSTQLPAFKLSGGAGTYHIIAKGGFNSGTSVNFGYRISDGTLASFGQTMVSTGGQLRVGVLDTTITEPSAFTNLTFQIQSANDGGATASIYNSFGFTPDIGMAFDVYYVPSQQQQAYNPSQSPASWSGTLVGSGGGWASTSTSFADPSTATTALTQLTKRNMTCSAEGTGLPGITCGLPQIGNYKVCASLTGSNNTLGGGSTFRIADGSGNAITGGLTTQAYGAGTAQPVTLCGDYSATSVASSTTFKIQLLVGGGTTGSIVENAVQPISWSVLSEDVPMAMPFLQGNVTSSSLGSERMERAAVTSGNCTSSPCTLDSNTPGVTSVTRTATGQYVAHFATGVFSAAPTCVCNATNNGTSQSTLCNSGTSTSTSFAFNVWRSSTETQLDSNFQLICQGPH